ncbi:MAG: hypothetical protein HPY69_11180 [Armatimonadetes bacterium]|nr:hypothetical protein [Armatimonadota bacterium]
MERIFPTDVLSKRERLERTLAHQPVDRVCLHEQLSYNPRVIADWTHKPVSGFNYGLEEIGLAIQRSLDTCFPPTAPCGTARVTSPDGFVYQHDNWTTWRVGRPFDDVAGARRWLLTWMDRLRNEDFDPNGARRRYREDVQATQALIGETVLINFSQVSFCAVFDAMGLELYTYFSADYPETLDDFMHVSCAHELRRVRAVGDRALSPVILIPEDFATKQGPIFPPAFLHRYLYPFVRELTRAWHEHGIAVIYHSDGNYRKAIPDLMACGVDGFYCLEPGVGMDIVDLKRTWPAMVWAGGVDGVDLMERGTPEQVRAEVRRHIQETDALRTGGMMVASSSEINPPIPPENYRAMVEAVGELRNPGFSQGET